MLVARRCKIASALFLPLPPLAGPQLPWGSSWLKSSPPPPKKEEGRSAALLRRDMSDVLFLSHAIHFFKTLLLKEIGTLL
jgi:hypothetical protein